MHFINIIFFGGFFMRKRYFLITFAIITIIAGVWVWACKHPFGSGISGISNVINGGGVPAKGWYMNESGGPGYKGEVASEVTNTEIVTSRMPPKGILVWNRVVGTTYYRIPALMQLPSGDLLAFADRRKGSIGDLPNSIEVVMKRSTDNGNTWSLEKRITPESKSKTDGHGDAGFILDRKTGNIICVVAAGNGFLASTPDDPIRIKIIKGVNNGETWSEPVDITPQIYGSACKDPTRKKWHAAFAASGNGVQLRNGRMLFVLSVRESTVNFAKNYVMYSDDGGDTWKVSKNAPRSSSGGDEAKIVELNDGSLLMAIRAKDIYQRRLAKSTDNGETWGEAVFRSDLPSSASNGDIIYYTSTLNGWDKNRIITMFDTKPYTSSSTPPADPMIYYSYDEGETWKGRLAFSAQAGYSSLAILKDGSIGVLLELGNSWSGPIYFTRANMKMLTKLTGDNDSGPFKVDASN